MCQNKYTLHCVSDAAVCLTYMCPRPHILMVLQRIPFTILAAVGHSESYTLMFIFWIMVPYWWTVYLY